MTIARRSSSCPSEERSVESRGGSIGKIRGRVDGCRVDPRVIVDGIALAHEGVDVRDRDEEARPVGGLPRRRVGRDPRSRRCRSTLTAVAQVLDGRIGSLGGAAERARLRQCRLGEIGLQVLVEHRLVRDGSKIVAVLLCVARHQWISSSQTAGSGAVSSVGTSSGPDPGCSSGKATRSRAPATMENSRMRRVRMASR
jgi:hypothetical protein